MRTTLTIDAGVAQQLLAVMKKQKLTMKAAINQALSEGIPRIGGRSGDRKPFVVVPFPLGLRAGIDRDRISQYADELYDSGKVGKNPQ